MSTSTFERIPSVTGLFIALLTVSVVMLAGMGAYSLATGGPVIQSLGPVAVAGIWYVVALRPRYARLP